jgi:DNA primase
MIQKIKENLDIVELAKGFGLMPNKNNFIYSIYKEENIPSLKLYTDTNSFFDFSTGRGGDVITFYAGCRNIDIDRAIHELTESKSVINFKRHFKSKRKEENKLDRVGLQSLKLFEAEAEYFEEIAGVMEYCNCSSKQYAEQLALKTILLDRIEYQKLIYEELEKFCSGVDEEVLSYLTGPKRGLTEEIIKNFRLFSIDDLTNTIKYLKDNFPPHQLQISGLFNERGNFVFGYHRLIIPYTKNGQIVYLRGRKLDMFDGCKYIGLCNYAQNLSARRFFNEDLLNVTPYGSELIITEGEFDCVRATQEGIPAIGIPGVNNFPKNKSKLLKNHKIFLAFDNDLPGLKGMKEVTNIIGKPTKAIILKNHKDLTEHLNGGK